LRRNDGGGLCHKMDPTKHYHVGFSPSRYLGQSKRIANIISDILNLRDLIVVREDDPVPLTFEPRDLRYQILSTAGEGCGRQ